MTTLRQQALSQITSSNLPGITSLLPQSVLGVLAYVVAGMAYGNYGFLSWIAEQSVPFTASNEYLDAWSNLRGVSRKAPTAAIGSVTLTGTSGIQVPDGTTLQRADGFQYTTTELATLANTTATISIIATATGSIGNAAANTTLTLTSPIAGVNSNGLASSAITGGTDLETDDALRTRTLQAYANPPQGGSINDYVTWALACPGVTRAWALGGGAGVGSVVVWTMFDQVEQAANAGFPVGSPGGATDETRISAATGDLLAVANYLYPLRPATALVYSAAPSPYSVNLTFGALTPNTTEVQNGIASALTDLFIRIGSPLGMTLYPSDLYEACASVPGITDFSIATPSVPLQLPQGYIPTTGNLTF